MSFSTNKSSTVSKLFARITAAHSFTEDLKLALSPIVINILLKPLYWFGLKPIKSQSSRPGIIYLAHKAMHSSHPSNLH